MSSTVTILGSTGSIGVSSLRVIESLNDEFDVYGLSCNNNITLLEEQIQKFHPCIVAVGSQDTTSMEQYRSLKKKFPNTQFFEGENGIIELASRNVDILLSAIVGSAGLKPTLSSLPYVRRVILANKETLVMAGDIFIQKVKDHNVELIPVDSEHNAIFSLIEGKEKDDIKRIIITASGGSMKDKTLDQMDAATPKEVLAHPIWNMGNKITIDSATLMNKGFEVIECRYLFDIDYNLIDVVIHPESIVHSLVETVDGAVFAYMSAPDMTLPIHNSLIYPEKRNNPFGNLDILNLGKLNFYPYNNTRFPALDLCYSVGRTGGTMPAVLNASNEIAVQAFLENNISFTNIVKIVEKTIESHTVIQKPDISDILDADKWAKEFAQSLIKGKK